MFVELNPYEETIAVLRQLGADATAMGNRQALIPTMISYPKYKVGTNTRYYLRMKISTQATLTLLRQKSFVFLIIVAVMLIGIYLLQGVNVRNIQTEYQNKVQTMVITDNIVKHYMGLSKIGVDMSYLVVNQLWGYKFSKFNISLRSSIMTVQQTNQYFKKYSIS